MKNHVWLVPAAASVAFLIFSLRVVATGGLFGFVTEHMRDGWGAQIGIDLLSAATIALFFMAPQARRYGIRFWPWVILTLLTGSIALFALAARILHARAAASDKLSPGNELGAAGAR